MNPLPNLKLNLTPSLITLLLLSSLFCRGDDTLFDNFGSYVSIEHQEGLGTDRILIVSRDNVYIGNVDENGYFNALGARAGTSVWGSQTGQSQVILLRTPVDEK
jgi:hypothetical protein